MSNNLTFLGFYFNLYRTLGGKMFINVSHNLKKLSTYFPENLYVVGGYVRNQILKIKSSDVDLASSVDIEEVSKRLKETDYSVKVKNISTGSLLISKDDEKYEYTAFRRDVYSQNGSHMPIRIERTNKLEEDAIRRDFSINAIYYNINKDEVADFYHGIIDLKDKVIRTLADPEDVLRFDGERILRLVRIAGELDFTIEKQTLKSAKKHVENIKNISGSRKFKEIEKILYCDKRYDLGKQSLKNALEVLNKLGVWRIFDFSKNKIKYQQVYKVEDRFFGLLIDIINTQKPACLQDFVERLLAEFDIEEKLAKKIYIHLAGYYDALGGMNNKEFFLKYFEEWSHIYLLLGAKSKRIQTNYNFFYRYIIEHGLVIKVSDLKIGKDDIKESFPEIDARCYDRILHELLSKVFDGGLANKKKDLLVEILKNKQKY